MNLYNIIFLLTIKIVEVMNLCGTILLLIWLQNYDFRGNKFIKRYIYLLILKYDCRDNEFMQQYMPIIFFKWL